MDGLAGPGVPSPGGAARPTGQPTRHNLRIFLRGIHGRRTAGRADHRPPAARPRARADLPAPGTDRHWFPARTRTRGPAAATEYQPHIGRGMLRGSVHDENSWSLGGTAGNAGLFGTAADVARFGEMLRQGGAVDEVRVLRPDTVAEMTRDQLPPPIDPGFRHGLGVRIGDLHWMGTLATAGAYGHTGFTGTSLLVDPSRDLVVVLLTNRVHPSREWSDIAEIRRAVAEFAADT
ncbi:serine hydrolase [Micromonospora sp. ATA32]|nr:serine hydrolase [Micromonospora sp. ATA32]